MNMCEFGMSVYKHICDPCVCVCVYVVAFSLFIFLLLTLCTLFNYITYESLLKSQCDLNASPKFINVDELRSK